MSSKKLFLYKLLVVSAGMLLADAGIGKLLDFAYYKIHYGEQARMTYAIDSSKEDIIILGSSRASHHYIPAVISSRLNLSCYNAGKDKQGLFYSQAVVEMILHRYRPKYVILDITPFSFDVKERGPDLLSILLPYYKKHPEIQSIVNKRSRWEWLKTKSYLYCYNSLPLQIFFNTISKAREAGAKNGYVPLYRTWNNASVAQYVLQQKPSPADSLLTKAFRDIIHITKEAGCKLVVVASPFYFPVPQEWPTIPGAKKICLDEGISFLDYSGSPAFLGNTQFFSDAYHLNDTGAQLLSGMLCTGLDSLWARKDPLAVKSH